MLVPFPLAPISIQQHLLTAANCTTVLHATQECGKIDAIIEGSPHIRSIVVPDLEVWLHASPIATFQCSKSWQEGKDDPWLHFHTSGTTGIPRLVTYTNRMMTSFNVANRLPEPKKQTQLGWHSNHRCYSVAPLSHFSGLCAVLQTPIFLDGIVIVGSRAKPLTPTTIADTIRYSKAQGLVALPFLLRAMVRQLESLEILKTLKYIQWVGAALDTDTGSLLASHVKLCPAMGTTECGPYFLRTAEDSKDWAYYSFQSGQGMEFIEKGDNLYELVFKKDRHALWQQVFLVFPTIDIYETKDLFRKHPTKEGLWAYVGRSDDVAVLANSANINASLVEDKLAAHPHVRMACVGGSGRDRSFAIIELTGTASKELEQAGSRAMFNVLRPAIEEANRGLSPYTMLEDQYIIITDDKRGLAKSPKGSLMRGPSLKMFEKDIETLFSAAK